MSEPTQQGFYRKIYRRARNSDLFTFADIRKECGVAGDDKQARNRLWNWFRRLKRNELVTEVDTGRKRHKYYKVVDADGLADLLSSSANGTGAVDDGDDMEDGDEPPSGFGLLSRLESNVQKVADQQGGIEDRLEEIEATQAELKRKLDHLVAIWS